MATEPTSPQDTSPYGWDQWDRPMAHLAIPGHRRPARFEARSLSVSTGTLPVRQYTDDLAQATSWAEGDHAGIGSVTDLEDGSVRRYFSAPTITTAAE